MILFLPAPALTLGPASLSLPELAQALTKAGMPTEAAPNLADRGAFVCLRDRSPEVMRRLLGEALGVSFRAQGTRWQMTVDPEAKGRERRLLIAYRRQAEARARDWAFARDRVRGGRSFAALERWTRKELVRLTDELKGADTERAQRELSPLLGVSIVLQPAVWCVVHDARNPRFTGAAVERPFEQPAVFSTPSRVYGLPEESVRSTYFPTAGLATAVRTSWSLDPSTGRFNVRPDLLFGDGAGVALFEPRPFWITVAGVAFSSMQSASVDVPAEGATPKETFDGMGADGQAYLASLASTTPPPDIPEVVDARPTLSHVLEGLGGKGLEAVMELSPRFERNPVPTLLEKTSLRRALAPVPSPPRMPMEGYTPWVRSALSPDDGPEALGRRFPWRAVVRDGAWLVIDPFAFLDRTQWISPVPYLRAERILAKIPKDAPIPNWFSDRPLPDWTLLSELSRAVGNDFDLDKASGYRGVMIGTYKTLLPVARQVENVPQGERPAFWKAARTKEGATLPTEHGVLVVRIEPMRATPNGPAFAHITGKWQEGGKTVETFDGLIDGRDLFD